MPCPLRLAWVSHCAVVCTLPLPVETGGAHWGFLEDNLELSSSVAGPIPWVYLSEILGDEIKGKAAAFCTSLNWVAALAIGLSFKGMLKLLGLSGAYLVFAVINVGGVLFAGSLMVETKQRPLDQIKKMLID